MAGYGRFFGPMIMTFVLLLVAPFASPRREQTAGWSGDHQRGFAARRKIPGPSNVSDGHGFPGPYHHDAPRGGNLYLGGFSWSYLARTSPQVLTFGRQQRASYLEAGETGKDRR